MLLASSGERPEMQPNILQCIEQPQMTVVGGGATAVGE